MISCSPQCKSVALVVVEDERKDGTTFLWCEEVGDTAHLICQLQDADGNKFWVHIPEQ